MGPPMNPRLETLPRELIHMIAHDHLDEADRASLALTSHSLRYSLGENKNKNLSEHYKCDFSSQLTRDIPNTYVCFYCEKLHPSQSIYLPGSGSPLPSSPLLTCAEQNPASDGKLTHPVDQVSSLYFNKLRTYALHFCHVALAMQRYRLGPSHGIPLEWLSSTIVCDRLHDNIRCLLSVEAQIAPVSPVRDDVSLILQIQTWTMHVRSEAGGAGAGPPANTPPSIGQKICRHMKFKPTIANTTEEFPDKQAWFDMTCTDCGIQPHVYTLNSQDCKALVVTRWLDLGPGLDIRDYRWNGAVQVNFHRWYEGGNGVELVKKRFLAAAGSDALELTTQRNEDIFWMGSIRRYLSRWSLRVIRSGYCLCTDKGARGKGII